MKKIIILIIGLIAYAPLISESSEMQVYTIEADLLFNAPKELSKEVLPILTYENIAISKLKVTEPQVSCDIDLDFSDLPQDAQKTFTKIAEILGCDKLATLKSIEVIENPNMPRALAGSYTLKLRSDVFAKAEFENLLIHELAHVIDLGYLKGTPSGDKSAFVDGSMPVYNNDLSIGFYSISWIDTTEKKQDVSEYDFVTGYATTDPFEDFAESLLYYVQHNKEFRILAQDNEALHTKYDFIKENIFANKVFETGKNVVETNKRSWDATKIF